MTHPCSYRPRLLVALAAGLLALSCAGAPDEPAPLRLLVLSGGGWHDFEGNLAILLPALAEREALVVTRLRLGPDDPPGDVPLAALAATDLGSRYDAILAYTQGDPGLTDEARAGLLAFVREGGGFVGLHSAADSHPGWEDYDALVGARFVSHPPFGEISVGVTDADHPVTAGLPTEWTLRDEFYRLAERPDVDKLVLMAGTSPAGGELRPVTWVRDVEGGRLAYTLLGHGPETHGDPRFQDLVARALRWVADSD